MATAAVERVRLLSILLPVRNEGVNLKILLKILKAVVEIPHEVLVIYDHPDDDSVPVVQAIQKMYPELRSVYNDKGVGVLNALRAGVDRAAGDAILIFAADEVGPVLAIEDMIGLIEEGCDLVSCTRYAHGGRRLGGSWIGGTLSRLANVLFSFLAGAALSDATTGIKLFRRSIWPRFQFHAKPVGWAFAFEMAIKAQLENLQLGEVPIISIDRLYGGKSTFKLTSWTKEYLRWFFWGYRELRKKGPANHLSVRVRVPKGFPIDPGDV